MSGPLSEGEYSTSPSAVRHNSWSDHSNNWGLPTQTSASSAFPSATSGFSQQQPRTTKHTSPDVDFHHEGVGIERGHGFGENLLNSAEDENQENWALPPQQKVEIHKRDEMSGIIFKHTIWFVASPDGAVVQRRYSDFVWLLDSLTRRYPFRLLPSLPPKHISISGANFGVDELFFEKRRKGLQRFLNTLINHPVLKHDGLLHTMLHEQTDLSVWRKQNPISLEEESTAKILTLEQEFEIPDDWEKKLNELRQKILPLCEIWSQCVLTAERIGYRRINQSSDLVRLQTILNNSLELNAQSWRPQQIYQTEANLANFAAGLNKVAELGTTSANKLLETSLEELKRHRDLFLNLRDLFARQISLSADSVDKLKKRTESNLAKLQNMRDSQNPTPPAEVDKITATIEADQGAVEILLRRRIFIRWCVHQEILYLFKQTSLLDATAQEWVKNEISFAGQLKANWQSTAETLGMET